MQPHLDRQARREKHPVYDFLFEYFTFKPTRLMRWSPGAGIVLEEGDDFLAFEGYTRHDRGVWLDPDRFPDRRVSSLSWVIDLLERIEERPPRFGCYGLHEWAMVYREDPNAIRHDYAPLRFAPDELASIVEAHQIVCTHFDAYRFFTPAARPLNSLNPEADTRHTFEQKGCVHVNMDLYKWAYKFYPWIGSDVIREAFQVAVMAREIDMQASPYDLRHLGFEPIMIETEAGKQIYQRKQQEIVERADPVREKLLNACRDLMRRVTV
ncbi:MAG: 3-methyladenine DNA glycosylase [Verrucomicrobiota bacterium]